MIIPAVSRQPPPNLRLTHTLSHMLAQEGEMPDAYFFLHEECRMSNHAFDKPLCFHEI